MKRKVNAFDYAKEIMEALPKGILITTKAEDKVNTMTIGWGTLGIEWGRPIFISYVREHRYTYEMLEKNPEFTINIPLGEVEKKILSVCGTKSGRDMDKIHELGLTLEESEMISVPGLKELPLTLECKVIYKQAQDLSKLETSYKEKYYSDDIPGDYHIAYYGEIVNAYIVE